MSVIDFQSNSSDYVTDGKGNYAKIKNMIYCGVETFSDEKPWGLMPEDVDGAVVVSDFWDNYIRGW